MKAEAGIAPRLLRWFDRHGRHELPWQQTRSPYRVWLSEVMLQQTQVATVIPYFERFAHALPDVRALADAPEDRVLALWSGLGYYRRARHLHEAAKQCVARHGGELPRDFDALSALPGIGRSTAGAILAQAFGERRAILDGNAKRVLARHRGVRGWPGRHAVEQDLWKIAEQETPHARVADYTQAIMDLGATVCKRASPRCGACPLSPDCVALREDLTAALPERKPPRALPQRRSVMLVLCDPRGNVLLQRRGPSGIWPGLWSLPEADDAALAREIAESLACLERAEIEVLPPFLHAFTHYRLEAQPLLWHNVSAHSAVADAPHLRWCSHAECTALGMPAPVRKLLAGLRDAAAIAITEEA
ncbi:MAG TPA: A/G-specific adenine glycosylase [Rhodanobacteraceae bacterium]|nr:A/G-specific adenine glycosylase [Rhodanobacteraceae bacterium]